MLASLVLAVGSLTAFTWPAERPRDDPGAPYGQYATAVTGAATFAGVLGIGLSAGGMERSRADAVRTLHHPDSWDLFDVPGDSGAWLLLPGTIVNMHGLGLSAVAGHLWARRDLARGDIHRGRATATTVIGSLALAAGLGLNIAGFLYPGTPCRRYEDDVEAEIACLNRTTYRGIAMMTSGAIMFDVGAGLVGYGGTALQARPSLSTSRHGATLGVTFAF